LGTSDGIHHRYTQSECTTIEILDSLRQDRPLSTPDHGAHHWTGHNTRHNAHVQNTMETFLKGRPEDTLQYTWLEHTGNVPEGQKSGPFRNTRQPQPIEHKRHTDLHHSRRADKITLWAHPTGYTTATHSLSAQRSRSSIAFAKIDH